jgi:hypothetical protein
MTLHPTAMVGHEIRNPTGRRSYPMDRANPTWAPNTKAAARTTLRSFYRWATVSDRIGRNPAEFVPVVKLPKGKPRPASDSDLHRRRGRGSLGCRGGCCCLTLMGGSMLPPMKSNPFVTALLAIAVLAMIAGVIIYFAGANQPDDTKLAVQGFGVAVANGGGISLFLWLVAAAIDWRLSQQAAKA